MESILQKKQSLLSTIGGINDLHLIDEISVFVANAIAKQFTKPARTKGKIVVPKEVNDIVRRIHPVDIKDEKKEYYEYLAEKYK